MRGRTNWIGLFCATCVLASGLLACKKKGDGAESQDESAIASADHGKKANEFLDNEPYRFRLTRPGPSWKLQERSEIQQLTPDAQAGLSHRRGLIGVVIVERAAGMSLDAMADLIIGGMPLEGKVVSSRKEVTFVGLPAIDYQIRGSINDVAMDYSGRIVLREGYAYQLVAFAARGVATAQDAEAFFDSFSLTEGEIDAKGELSQQVDTAGVGWRLEGGVFESAVSGLRVKPTGNWRAVIGAEARRINADAEVVLVSLDPEAYFILLPERAGGVKPAVYRKDRLDQTSANIEGKVSKEDYTGTFLGQSVPMSTLRGDGLPWTFEVGVAFDQGWAIQATGWYSASYGEAGKAAIVEAMSDVTRMSGPEVDALRAELLALPDGQNQVGANYSLRDGVFEDYEHGVRWTKPEGFWEVSAGHAARDVNPIAQLYGRYQNSAAHVLLVAETLAPGMTASDYHSAAYEGVRANLNLQGTRGAEQSRIASGPAITSEATADAAGIPLFYRVTTAVQGSRGLQLHLWGPAPGLAEHAPALAKVAQNLEILADLRPTSRKGTRFVDHRLGYSMDLPAQYRYVDSTPTEIAGIGSFASWGVDGQDWVGLLALCMIEEGQDHEWSLDFMQEKVEDSYGALLHGLRPTRSDSELFGTAARRLIWKNSSARLDAYLFRKGKTIYALLATDRDHGTDMLARAVAGFRFL